MDNDRAFKGRLSDQTAYPFAAIVVLTLIVVVGVGLITNQGRAVSPPDATVAVATASPVATRLPSMPVTQAFSPSQFVGLVGLPPEGAPSSVPSDGELVDTWWVGERRPPYIGAARLYADGRLIWNRYYNGPEGQNSQSTGYIEQRLTAEGVALVRAHENQASKSPWRLPEWLPLGAWEDRTPRPYVPSGYGVCLNVVDTPPSESPPGPTERARILDVLPASVSSLLRDSESVWAPDYGVECLAQTTEEARVLDRALRDAGFEQDEFFNRFLLHYALDIPGGLQVTLVFEPRFPDGSIGCSACG